MEFGMPTLLELDSLDANVRLAQKLGLSFVEINCNVPEFQADVMSVAEIMRLREETGIRFTLHLDEYLSITDPNRKISEAYMQSVLDSIELAKQTGIDRLTMHFLPGVVFTLPTHTVYVYDKYAEFYHERLRTFRRKVERAIGDADIRLCIENVSGFAPYMQKGIEILLESPVFGLTYDCGHNARYDQVDWKFIQTHRERIRHMHLHDVKGKKDHQPLGHGDLDLKSELDFVRPNNPSIVVEVKSVEALSEAVKGLKTLID